MNSKSESGTVFLQSQYNWLDVHCEVWIGMNRAQQDDTNRVVDENHGLFDPDMKNVKEMKKIRNLPKTKALEFYYA